MVCEQVEVSVEPFTKKLPNVLDLPMVQKFVEMGLAAAVSSSIQLSADLT